VHLKNSEVLFLSQILFHLKNSNSYQDVQHRISDLLQRCDSYILSSENTSEEISDDCQWHDHDELEESIDSTKEVEDEPENTISSDKLISLDQINVFNLSSCKKNKLKWSPKSFLFEKGNYKSAVDISLDDGDQYLCDVERICCSKESFCVTCAEGDVTFTLAASVSKFPKSWTSLLELGICYKVV